jgi:hypothetical protein
MKKETKNQNKKVKLENQKKRKNQLRRINGPAQRAPTRAEPSSAPLTGGA